MATITTNIQSGARQGADLLSRIGAGFVRGFEAFVEARAKTSEIERFNAMSDAELARRGIHRREDIVRHVFRNSAIF